MKSRSRVAGFTIVETLIVLAVTGGLLISAAAVINGRQNRTQFSQGVRDMESRIQKVMNEVTNGFYPNNSTISCVSVGGNPILTSAATEQGANTDCLFLGRVMQFGVGGTELVGFNTYSVVGLRANASGPVTTLTAARPRLIARTATDLASVPDVFNSEKLPYGLTATKMYYNNNPALTIGAVGFVSNLGSQGVGDSSQRVNVLAIPSTSLDMSKETAVAAINGSLPGAIVNPSQGVQICLKSSGTIQSALVTIGGEGRQFDVSLSVKSNTECT